MVRAKSNNITVNAVHDQLQSHSISIKATNVTKTTTKDKTVRTSINSNSNIDAFDWSLETLFDDDADPPTSQSTTKSTDTHDYLDPQTYGYLCLLFEDESKPTPSPEQPDEVHFRSRETSVVDHKEYPLTRAQEDQVYHYIRHHLFSSVKAPILTVKEESETYGYVKRLFVADRSVHRIKHLLTMKDQDEVYGYMRQLFKLAKPSLSDVDQEQVFHYMRHHLFISCKSTLTDSDQNQVYRFVRRLFKVAIPKSSTDRLQLRKKPIPLSQKEEQEMYDYARHHLFKTIKSTATTVELDQVYRHIQRLFRDNSITSKNLRYPSATVEQVYPYLRCLSKDTVTSRLSREDDDCILRSMNLLFGDEQQHEPFDWVQNSPAWPTVFATATPFVGWTFEQQHKAFDCAKNSPAWPTVFTKASPFVGWTFAPLYN
ncbi:hypothetical protein HDU76_003234 [Blyttiomyces sp. JEL0837]|nr:hypothetical protein HDU76_003234 [Blyttiomyces sp. JEL0837]